MELVLFSVLVWPMFCLALLRNNIENIFTSDISCKEEAAQLFINLMAITYVFMKDLIASRIILPLPQILVSSRVLFILRISSCNIKTTSLYSFPFFSAAYSCRKCSQNILQNSIIIMLTIFCNVPLSSFRKYFTSN